MIIGRNRAVIASVAALVASVILALLAGPGSRPALSADPRTALCGSDCFPASHPWLLILAAALAVSGLIGLRIALRRASQ